jgi:hypothetical protein
VALLFIGSGLVGILYYGSLFERTPAALTVAVPVLAQLAPNASGSILGKLLLFFLKAGSLTFGSGMVIVPFLEQGLVRQFGWLDQRQFLIAVAIGMISPGPVVITRGLSASRSEVFPLLLAPDSNDSPGRPRGPGRRPARTAIARRCCRAVIGRFALRAVDAPLRGFETRIVKRFEIRNEEREFCNAEFEIAMSSSKKSRFPNSALLLPNTALLFWGSNGGRRRKTRLHSLLRRPVSNQASTGPERALSVGLATALLRPAWETVGGRFASSPASVAT